MAIAPENLHFFDRDGRTIRAAHLATAMAGSSIDVEDALTLAEATEI